MSAQIYGYWSQSYAEAGSSPSEFPWPVATNTPVSSEFIDKLEQVETFLIEQGKCIGYRGISMCRCCKKPNGFKEFKMDETRSGDTIVWPQGYKHYLKMHNVQPDPKFVTIIENAFQQIPGTRPKHDTQNASTAELEV